MEAPPPGGTGRLEPAGRNPLPVLEILDQGVEVLQSEPEHIREHLFVVDQAVVRNLVATTLDDAACKLILARRESIRNGKGSA
jgi:hypothetical protein